MSKYNRLKEMCELVDIVNNAGPLTKGYSDEEIKQLFSLDKKETSIINDPAAAYNAIINCEYC